MDKNFENESTLNLEKSFLGGVFCLTSKEELSSLLDIVRPHHFSTVINREIFKAMENKFEIRKKFQRILQMKKIVKKKKMI